MLIRLTLLMWPHGSFFILLRRMSWLDWSVVALLVIWAAWHYTLGRQARRRTSDPALVAPLVRFWTDWRKTGLSVLDLELEGAHWTVRSASSPVSVLDRAPAIAVEIPPKCPKCGFVMTEAPVQRGTWYRDCTSSTCRNRALSRRSFQSTAELIRTAAAEAWTAASP